MNKQIRDFLVSFLILVALLFSFYGVAYLFNNSENKNVKAVKKTEIKEKEKKKDKEKEKPYVEPYVNNLPIHRSYYGNNNIAGMILIPGLFGDTLVTRGEDNEFYLDRNLWNVYDGIGAPFFDYRNTDLDHDKQVNIYGHNSQNYSILDKLPLSKLISYLDANVFNTYKDLYLYTDTQQVHYEVIGAKVISKDNNFHMTIHFYYDNDFIDHTYALLDGSTNKRDVKITKKDRILVLQTCNYDPPDSLVIIICKTV